MSTTTQTRGTNLGPLTATFTPPTDCNVLIQQCDTCDSGWIAQDCYSSNLARDRTECWPSATTTADNIPLTGWGYYSPGLVCPAGYTSACTAVSQAAGDTSSYSIATTAPNLGAFQFALVAGETAVGCCPTGYECKTVDSGHQTCQSVATKTSISVVTCESAKSNGLKLLYIPVATGPPTTTVSSFTLNAPLIQINWQASDRPSSPSSAAASTTDSGIAHVTGFASQLPSSSGLSTGAKAGIGVGAALGALLVLGLALFFLLRGRKKRTQPNSPVDQDYYASETVKYRAVATTQELQTEHNVPELPGQRVQTFYELDPQHEANRPAPQGKP